METIKVNFKQPLSFTQPVYRTFHNEDGTVNRTEETERLTYQAQAFGASEDAPKWLLDNEYFKEILAAKVAEIVE